MNRPAYIVVIHRDGKQKAYRTERYLLIKRLKFIGALVSATAVMLLLCGAAVAEDCPIMPLHRMAGADAADLLHHIQFLEVHVFITRQFFAHLISSHSIMWYWGRSFQSLT